MSAGVVTPLGNMIRGPTPMIQWRSAVLETELSEIIHSKVSKQRQRLQLDARLAGLFFATFTLHTTDYVSTVLS